MLPTEHDLTRLLHYKWLLLLDIVDSSRKHTGNGSLWDPQRNLAQQRTDKELCKRNEESLSKMALDMAWSPPSRRLNTVQHWDTFSIFTLRLPNVLKAGLGTLVRNRTTCNMKWHDSIFVFEYLTFYKPRQF